MALGVPRWRPSEPIGLIGARGRGGGRRRNVAPNAVQCAHQQHTQPSSRPGAHHATGVDDDARRSGREVGETRLGLVGLVARPTHPATATSSLRSGGRLGVSGAAVRQGTTHCSYALTMRCARVSTPLSMVESRGVGGEDRGQEADGGQQARARSRTLLRRRVRHNRHQIRADARSALRQPPLDRPPPLHPGGTHLHRRGPGDPPAQRCMTHGPARYQASTPHATACRLIGTTLRRHGSTALRVTHLTLATTCTPPRPCGRFCRSSGALLAPGSRAGPRRKPKRRTSAREAPPSEIERRPSPLPASDAS